jgi:hypothetical protein
VVAKEEVEEEEASVAKVDLVLEATMPLRRLARAEKFT